VEQELVTLLEHVSSPPVFSGARVARFLVFFGVFFFLSLFVILAHSIVCPSSAYGFWVLLWYLQTFNIQFIICTSPTVS